MTGSGESYSKIKFKSKSKKRPKGSSPQFSRPTVPRPVFIDDFENLPVPTSVPRDMKL